MYSLHSGVARADEERSALEYGKECIQSMGLKPDQLPSFMSCIDEPNSYQIPDIAYPSWLSSNNDYNRISRMDFGDVTFILNCRQKVMSREYEKRNGSLLRVNTMDFGKSQTERFEGFSRNPNVLMWDAIYGFNDIALIIHQKKTGKTCFFQDAGLGDTQINYGKSVPMPYSDRAKVDVNKIKEEVGELGERFQNTNIRFGSKVVASLKSDAAAFWAKPAAMSSAITCTNCHDSGPWIRSPRWALVKDSNGQHVVPTRDSIDGVPTEPYFVVGAELQKAWFPEKSPRIVSTEPIPTRDRRSVDPQRCNECHAMGGNKSTHREDSPNDRGLYSFFSSWADLETIITKFEFTLDSNFVTGENPRMPPIPTGQTRHDMKEWEENYLRSYTAIQCCGDFPNALGCKTMELGRSTIPKQWKLGSDSTVSCLPPVVTAQIQRVSGMIKITWNSKYARECVLKLRSTVNPLVKEVKVSTTGSYDISENEGKFDSAEVACSASLVFAFQDEKTHSIKLKL